MECFLGGDTVAEAEAGPGLADAEFEKALIAPAAHQVW
jgi:hypothetical protein